MVNIFDLIKRLRFRYPLFTTTIEQLEFLEEYRIPTAATDGKYVYYNPNFLGNLNSHQQLFILAHEVSHVALNHLARSKGKEMSIWNIATDAVINAFLVRDGLEPVAGVIFIDNALAYSCDDLYEMLKSDQKEEQNMADVKGDKQQSESSHQKWSDGESEDDDSSNENSTDNTSPGKGKSGKSQEKDKSNPNDDKGNSGTDNTDDENDDNLLGNQSDNDNEDESDNDASGDDNQIDERKLFDDNMEQRKKNEKNLRNSINSKGFSLGNPGYDSPDIKINNIGKKSNIIDWRRLLKEACKLDLDYSYRDAQIEDGVLVSHLIEIPSCETEILLDTSGSIDHNLLKAFLRECKNILQSSKIKVACFDSKVYEFTNIRTEADLDKMKFKGGGGTNFEAASKGFTNRVDNKIIFTDGYGYVKNPPLDIIWVVFESAKNLPKEATVIKVDRKKLLKNLC